jgi:hypothetical protein
VVKLPDYVHRRVIIEYGRRYVYATLTDANGKIIEEEVWKQPYLLDPKDASDEARDVFDVVYQFLIDTLTFPGTASDGDAGGKPES